MPETAEQRREHARTANLHRQLSEPSGAAMTAPARAVANDPDRFRKLARERHPGASEADIDRMARAARDLWVSKFSRLGVEARQARALARAAEADARTAVRSAKAAERQAAQLADAADELTG